MRYVPKSAVRGIQLGLGLLFLKKGLELIISNNVCLGLDRRARAKARYIINKSHPLLNDVTFN